MRKRILIVLRNINKIVILEDGGGEECFKSNGRQIGLFAGLNMLPDFICPLTTYPEIG